MKIRRKTAVKDGKTSREKTNAGQQEKNVEENEVVTYVNTSEGRSIKSAGHSPLTEEPVIYANLIDTDVKEEEVCYCELSFNPDGLKQTQSLTKPSDENQTIYATIVKPGGVLRSKP